MQVKYVYFIHLSVEILHLKLMTAHYFIELKLVRIYFQFDCSFHGLISLNIIWAFEHLGKIDFLAICWNIIRQQDFPFNNIYLKSK